MPDRARKIRVEGELAFIPLTKGYEARISASSEPLVSGYNWTAMVASNTIWACSPVPQQRTLHIAEPTLSCTVISGDCHD